MCILLQIILLISCSTGFSQSTQRFAPEQLQADLATLRENMELVQPGLYTYFSKEEQDEKWERIASNLDQPMTAVEFYRELSPMIKYIANGHNRFLPSKEHISYLSNEAPRFPLDLAWDGDNLFVLRNVSNDSTIKEGSIIKSINGEPVNDLLAFITDRLTRDGYNYSMPIRNATLGFKTHYALFVGTPERFDIEFLDGDQNTTSSIEALTIKEISENRKTNYPNLKKAWYLNDEPAYTLELKDDYAIMTLRTFATGWIKSSGPSYKKFFKEAFEQIKASGVQNLVIDMRSNGGGDTEPTLLLLSYLYDQPVDFYSGMNLNVNKIPNHKLYESKLGLINTFSWVLVRKKDDAYELRSIDKYHRKKKPEKSFDGQVYALLNASSFSATGEMAGALKAYTNTIFVGEESGGNPVVNTSGEMLNLILPNTKVQATIPIVEFVMNVPFENDGRGIIPDYPVQPSIEEWLSGEDMVMKKVEELIRSEK